MARRVYARDRRGRFKAKGGSSGQAVDSATAQKLGRAYGKMEKVLQARAAATPKSGKYTRPAGLKNTSSTGTLSRLESKADQAVYNAGRGAGGSGRMMARPASTYTARRGAVSADFAKTNATRRKGFEQAAAKAGKASKYWKAQPKLGKRIKTKRETRPKGYYDRLGSV